MWDIFAMYLHHICDISLPYLGNRFVENMAVVTLGMTGFAIEPKEFVLETTLI